MVGGHLVFYTTAPRCLLFLLPYPIVYLIPFYNTMKALQESQAPKIRALWLSYWTIIGFIDFCELVTLGNMVQALTYWPIVKVLISIFLMSTTTDYSVSPKIDKDLEDDLRRSLRTERKLKTARGEEKGKVAAWEKTMKAKNEVEVAKTKSRPKRYHAFMLVEAFLPNKATAGGPDINWQERPEPPKIDPKTGRPEKTDQDKRDRDYETEILKRELYEKGKDTGEGLGNWLQPVIDYKGQIVDHNPLTDQYGNIKEEHIHGESGKVKYGTPWDGTPGALTKAGKILGSDPGGDNPHRQKDGKRIAFLPDVAWREYASDMGETGPGEAPWNLAARERGLDSFQGYNTHVTSEVGELDHSRQKLHDSVGWGMADRQMGSGSWA